MTATLGGVYCLEKGGTLGSFICCEGDASFFCGNATLIFEGLDGERGMLLQLESFSIGILTRFNAVAMSNIALYVLSPACKLGNMALGGYFKMETKSVAVCFKKSRSDTDGNGISVGKKVTVSDTRSALDFGM